MRTVYSSRDRHALPAAVALLLAAIATDPIQSIVVASSVAHSSLGRLMHVLFILALFVWLFVPADRLWARWLSRRPSLAVVGGVMPRPSQEIPRQERDVIA